MRLVWIFIALAVVFLIPFLIWGEAMESSFTGDGAVKWLVRYRDWAWVAGYLLLALDLFLPVFGTAVMSGLGYIYGVIVGGLIGLAGSVSAAMLGYALCRFLGHGVAERLLGAKDMGRGEHLFASGAGGWIVALSRWLPLLPEAVACFAGLVRMPFLSFTVAVLCGSVPLAFTFAAVGSLGEGSPMLALGLSAVIPVVLWVVFGKLVRRHGPRVDES